MILPLSACHLLQGGDSKTIMRIGQFEISQKMVNDREQILRLTSPKQVGLGLRQLQEAYINAQILMNHGVVLDDRVLANEEKRVDQNTRRPEQLQQIKEIFGRRQEDYRRAFILPVYANRTIYFDFFLNDPQVQAESFAPAKVFHEAVRAKKSLWWKLVKDGRIRTAKAVLTAQEGFQFKFKGKPPESFSASPADQFGRQLIEQWIQPIQPGHAVPEIINYGEAGWLVIRYVKPTSGKSDSYELQVAVFPKINYDKWHREQAARVLAAGL